MPSSSNPNDIVTGPGKVPANSVDATAQLYNPAGSSGNSSQALLTSRPVVSGLLSVYPSYVSVGEVSKVITSGTIWLGDNPSQPEEDLFTIVKADSDLLTEAEPVLNSTGYPLTVSSISGYSIGDGWVSPTGGAPLTFNFGQPLISGTTYRILYGRPQSLNDTSDLSADAMIRLTSHTTRNQTAHIHTAVAGGLNERYNRSSAPISPFANNPDTPGDGGTIDRAGPALRMRLPWADTTSGENPDPLQSAFKTEYAFGTYTSYTNGYGGDVGHALIASDRMTVSDVSEESGQGKSRSSVSTFIRRSIAANTVDGGARTFIQESLTSATVVGNTITLGSGGFFRNGNGTAIWDGHDILVLDYGSGDIRSFRIQLTAVANVGTLLPLSGTGTVSGADGTPLILAWHHSYVDVGGTGGNCIVIRYPRFIGDSESDANSNNTRAFRMVQANRFIDYISLDWEDEFATVSFPRFFVDGNGDCGTKNSWSGALGNVDDGQAKTRAAGVMRHAFAQRYLYHSITTDQTYRINPRGDVADPGNGDDGEGFGAMHIRLNGTVDTAVQIDFDGSNLSDGGGIWFEILIENVTGMIPTFVWPSQAKFSDPADAVPGPGFVAGKAIKYKGTVWGPFGDVWLMERMDYSL